MSRATFYLWRTMCVFEPLGKVLVVFGLSMLLPVVVELVFMRQLVHAFLVVGALCTGVGALLWHWGRPHVDRLKVRHVSLLVLVIWLLLPLIGALPLLAVVDGAFADAYFEAVSGLTASGGTVLANINELPLAIKLWRGEMSWMGGMGLIVLATAILPNIGSGGRQMMKSELTGPLKNQDLTPQINETAKGLWLIYIGLTLVCLLAYWLAGMGLVDAVVHSFTTLALGGFSNHDSSFAYFDSPLIEAIAIIFMIIAGFNFATHFSCVHSLRRRRLPFEDARPQVRLFNRIVGPYRQDIELRPYLYTLLAGCAIVVGYLWLATDMPWGAALRHGIFNTVSIATTTGYSSADFFAAWPLFLCLLILFMANFNSCSGSTGGGIKMARMLVFLNRTDVEQTQLLHPYAFSEVKLGGRVVATEIVVSIMFFVLIYLFTILLFALLLLALQPSLDLLTAFSASMASVSNTGPGLGEVGPGSNFASLNPAATVLCSLAMLLGRLEFLLFLLLFSKDFWR